jgi:hypothetical protein
MEQGNSSLRNRLLARLPQPENLEAYREEVAAAMEKNQRKLQWTKWGARALWAYVIAFAMVCFYRGQQWLDTANGHKWALASLVLFICGSLELMKFFIARTRVEILKEVKQVQLQVLELQASLQKDVH